MTKNSATRRTFIGSMAAGLGLAGIAPSFDLFAQTRKQGEPGQEHPEEDYDGMAKLASNENCWGPSDDVVKAMTNAFKYANRYQYPDGGIVARRLLQKIGHLVRHAANGSGHPEVQPRNLEADGVVIDHRHATTVVVQL